MKIDNVDFEKKIFAFKDDVSKKSNIPKDSLELVYRGNILDDEATLTSCGLKPGVMVYALKKSDKEVQKPTPTMSETDIQALVVAFRTLTLNPSYRNALQKLSRPDILDNIIMATPGLSQDPIAISMIQDPELLVRMGDIETVRRIVELHPALAEAANHIAAAVHEDALSVTSLQPSTSSGYANVNDLLSDEDDMESSQSSDSIPQSVSRQQSFSQITAAQLAAALASASQRPEGSIFFVKTGEGSGSGNGGGSANSGITQEMFSLAMQRAIANVTSAHSQPSQPASEVSYSGSGELAEQMRQMRELGLTDDALNLQALQLAGGNVHAAVDLVFSGAISSPNHP
ncbi:hypothetical protein AAG570_004138 [Ranatra chinensis]|uniref:Ubiquitin-like protein 7 n=1 Tax=Ranatra chinensis TaxID=642074 RepID=A0ABD0YHF1_9HEMI